MDNLLELFHSTFVDFGIVDYSRSVDIGQIDEDQISIACSNCY
jgi:hypothetical protein